MIEGTYYFSELIAIYMYMKEVRIDENRLSGMAYHIAVNEGLGNNYVQLSEQDIRYILKAPLWSMRLIWLAIVITEIMRVVFGRFAAEYRSRMVKKSRRMLHGVLGCPQQAKRATGGGAANEYLNSS